MSFSATLPSLFAHFLVTFGLTSVAQDNYYSPDHISSLVDLMVANDLDWAYTLRTMAMHGEPIAHDRCESLGFLHEVWDWCAFPATFWGHFVVDYVAVMRLFSGGVASGAQFRSILGILRDGMENFSAAHSQNHVDTNCYMARRPVALAMAKEWNCLPRHNDRCCESVKRSLCISCGVDLTRPG